MGNWHMNLLKFSHPCYIMHKHQHSSSPLSTGFSFFCFCFLIILWNEVFFWDGDGPDVAKTKKKRAWKCCVMESKWCCFLTERIGPVHLRCGKYDFINRCRVGNGWNEILKNSHCVYSLEKSLTLFLPFPTFKASSWTVELSLFFFFTTVVPFLSNVIGLYCGRLLNFFSNSSSSFPRLTSEIQSSYR